MHITGRGEEEKLSSATSSRRLSYSPKRLQLSGCSEVQVPVKKMRRGPPEN